jgi:hypothetical protein
MILDPKEYDTFPGRQNKLKHYNRNGYPTKSLQDSDPVVRLNAYRKLGFTKDALADEHHAIRFEAYAALGWTNDAYHDPMDYIKAYALSQPVKR